MKAFLSIIFATTCSFSTQAAERTYLVLKAFVPLSINTQISQTQLSSSQSLVTFSSQVNSKFIRERQKFEVEGLNQAGLEGRIRRVAGNGRTVQYELLVKHLKATMPADKPIFLKISAN